MKNFFLDKYIESSNNMLSMFLGDNLQEVKREEFQSPIKQNLKEVYVEILFFDKDTKGDKFRGKFILSIPMSLAKKIASNMMGGFEVNDLDEMSMSALSECGNMIAGNACTLISSEVSIDIYPPTLHSGENNSVLFKDSVYICTLLFPNLNEEVFIHISMVN